MTEEAIQGTCEDCGKVYRVPSADRTYRCKACGGTVSVYDDDEEEFEDEEEEDEEEEAPRSRRRRGKRRDDDDDDDDDDEYDEGDGKHRASDRLRHHHGARDSSKVVWLSMGAVLLIGAIAFILHIADMAPWSDKGEIDLNVVNASFAEDWGTGNHSSISAYYHPRARAVFDQKLDKMVEIWGWDGEFPAITVETASVTKEVAGVPSGESTLKFGGDKELRLLWQYEKAVNKWYIYDLETSSPPIEARVEQLKTLWAKSNPDSLRPLFFKESATNMVTRVRDRAKKDGWGGSFPELGDYTTSLDDSGRTRVTFKVSDGDLTAKFGFSQEKYTWYISGFVWP